MYNLKGRKGAAEHSVLARREVMPELSWERKGCHDALFGEASCQKQQQLLEVGACEDLLAHGGRCAEQRRLEAEMGLSQEANGQSSPLQGGELLVQSKRLDSGSWRMDFDSESNCEEIYWGCFYFFPWLRMWRRERRERP